MTAPLNSSAVLVDKVGRGTRALIAYLQSIGTGVVRRTTYTFADISVMTPTLGDTVICTDSSVTTIGSVLAGGGANVVQAIGDNTDWRVI